MEYQYILNDLNNTRDLSQSFVTDYIIILINFILYSTKNRIFPYLEIYQWLEFA